MRESGPKGAVLITACDGRVTEVEHRPLDVVRFGVCPVEVSGIDSLEQAAERGHRALVERASELGNCALAVRFLLRGASGIGRLLSHAPPARSDAFRHAARAVRNPPIWVEGVWAELDPVFGGSWPLDPPVAAAELGVE